MSGVLSFPGRVDRHTAAIVLWHYGHTSMPAHRPGDFEGRLVSAAAHADPTNLARIGFGFPEVVEAVRLITLTESGVEVLTRIASGEDQG